MIDILDPQNISIINKDKFTFLYRQKLVAFDEMYDFSYAVSEEDPNDPNYKENIDEMLKVITNSINVNVIFPPKIVIEGKNYLFRKKRKTLNWKHFKAGVYNEEDIPIKVEHNGIFVMINAGLEHGETVYFNDEEVTISTNQSIVKLVKKDEIVNINAALSEDHIILIWFVVYYEQQLE